MKKLKYDNTNSFFVQGESGGLLFDTDCAGTLPALYKAMKQNGIVAGVITPNLFHPLDNSSEGDYNNTCNETNVI